MGFLLGATMWNSGSSLFLQFCRKPLIIKRLILHNKKDEKSFLLQEGSKQQFMWNSMFGKILMTFLISMVPVVELRGAIPIAVANGVNLWVAILVSIIGNMVPVPFIIVFIKRIFSWLRKKSVRFERIVNKLETRAAKKSDSVQKYAFWGLFILVAIPLPGTGAWTGALVAAMLEMPMKKAIPSILMGVIAAGVIVAFVTYGAGALFFHG